MEMDWLVCIECIEMEINGYVWSFDEGYGNGSE